MENTIKFDGYDYRLYDDIWRRVSPELNPYPEVRAMAQQSAEPTDTTAAAENPPQSGSGALQPVGSQINPCCMGSNAVDSLDVLRGFLRNEIADRQRYLALARRAPTPDARRMLQSIAADEQRHARRLMAALYIITGTQEVQTLQQEAGAVLPYREALRKGYHEAACSAFNYRRAADETLDPCLRELLLGFSEDEYRHARAMLTLLARNMPM